MPTLSQTSSTQPVPLSPTPESCQAIVFPIANRWFAIPHAAFLRVVPKTALHQQAEADQLMYLGKQPLPILNLRPLMGPNEPLNAPEQLHSTTRSPESQVFVIAAVETTLVAIPVDQAPVLLELPLAACQPVPPAYYNAIAGIASHVVAVPRLGSVLLLNLSAVSQGLL